jgi:hypothetical protein
VVSNGVGAVTSGVPVSTGNLTTNTTFILTVTNAAGVTAMFSSTVNVVPGPAITAFTAAKNYITVGSSTSLSYSFTGGSGSIDRGIGNVVSGGTSDITPTTTTTYTLTVTDPAGSSASKSLTVNVVPAPRITSFSATPATIAPGGGAVLNAVFENGVGTVDQSIGTVTSGAGVTTSALAVTTTYTLTVTNPASDSVTATTSVTVTRFSATGSMATPRTGHTATLLQNGKVLIVGGTVEGPVGNTTVLSSAELYDPTTGTFTPTGSLNEAKSGHTATLLPSGNVLIVGRIYVTSFKPSCELYDPSAGTFTPAGPTNRARAAGHTATLLQNGKVLIVGGSGDSYDNQDPSAELYDPFADTFAYTGSIASGGSKFGHTATMLQNGRVLIAGGLSYSPMTTSSMAELYDPSSGTFAFTAGRMNTSRSGHTATLLQDGKVLIAGRYYSFSQPITAELYDPTVGTFAVTGQMITDGSGQTATLLPSGNVLLAGGYTGSDSGSPANPEVYDPSSGAFSVTGSLRTPRTGHTATLLQNGKVLIAGGGTSSAELYE